MFSINKPLTHTSSQSSLHSTLIYHTQVSTSKQKMADDGDKMADDGDKLVTKPFKFVTGKYILLRSLYAVDADVYGSWLAPTTFCYRRDTRNEAHCVHFIEFH